MNDLRPDQRTRHPPAEESGAQPSASPVLLSELHAALRYVSRETTPHRLNRIQNAPEVYPWLKGYAIGPLDASPLFADPDNVVVLAHDDLAAVIFQQMTPGVWEGHTQAKNIFRGEPMEMFCRSAVHWLFTHTTAVEILARVPKGNYRVAALTKMLGFTHHFTAAKGWVIDRDPVPARVFSLTIQDWMVRAPGLVERGHWFHVKLEAEFAKAGKTEPNHPDDEEHDRYVGLAYEMALGGQPDKAALFYLRWALIAGYVPFTIVSREPLVVDIETAQVLIRPDGDFWCPLVR